jgi:hypothetical protein
VAFPCAAADTQQDMTTPFALFGRPTFLRGFHAAMTAGWAVLIIPSVLWWSDSIRWVVVMSVWANLAGHFSSWQAARVEVKQDGQIETD